MDLAQILPDDVRPWTSPICLVAFPIGISSEVEFQVPVVWVAQGFYIKRILERFFIPRKIKFVI